MNKKSYQYNLEGLKIDVPLKKREGENGYIEDYSELIDYPKNTPLGHPIILSFYEPCELFKEEIGECSDCVFFKKSEVDHFSLLGICTHESKRKQN